MLYGDGTGRLNILGDPGDESAEGRIQAHSRNEHRQCSMGGSESHSDTISIDNRPAFGYFVAIQAPVAQPG